MVKRQGGDLSRLEISNRIFSVRSAKAGYVTKINALGLGEIARKIGAGRLTKEDKIHYQVGLLLHKKVGDFVEVNEELVKVYLDDKDIKVNDILDCFTIEEEPTQKEPLIYEIID